MRGLLVLQRCQRRASRDTLLTHTTHTDICLDRTGLVYRPCVLFVADILADMLICFLAEGLMKEQHQSHV